MKNKIDRDRGTSPAELRSSGPKRRPDKGSDESSALDGESIRRDVPADEMDTIRFEEHDERDYKKKCKAYFGKDPIFINEDEEYAKHLAKFFKGEVE